MLSVFYLKLAIIFQDFKAKYLFSLRTQPLFLFCTIGFPAN